MESAFTGIVSFLALLGGVALTLRLVRAVGRVAYSTAELAASLSIADSGSRRGDLTAMTEGRMAAGRARTARRESAMLALVVLVWLAVPLALNFLQEGYALAAPLWLLPSRPIRMASQTHSDGS